MIVNDSQLPASLPLLSRGKHRNPRKGACFMELASVLAGQRWSDHPACTHPLLATVARYVNDFTTDSGRQRLIRLIPSVIGVTSDDLRVDAKIVLHCATTALPVASAERQSAMAVAIWTAHRLLADLDGTPDAPLPEASARALAAVPHAAKFADAYPSRPAMTPKAFRRRSAPGVIACAVVGIAHACIPDPDAMLYDLLAGAILSTSPSAASSAATVDAWSPWTAQSIAV